jgi:hypothetical protein
MNRFVPMYEYRDVEGRRELDALRLTQTSILGPTGITCPTCGDLCRP